jgi:hypothetical protein
LLSSAKEDRKKNLKDGVTQLAMLGMLDTSVQQPFIRVRGPIVHEDVHCDANATVIECIHPDDQALDQFQMGSDLQISSRIKPTVKNVHLWLFFFHWAHVLFAGAVTDTMMWFENLCFQKIFHGLHAPTMLDVMPQ